MRWWLKALAAVLDQTDEFVALTAQARVFALAGLKKGHRVLLSVLPDPDPDKCGEYVAL